MKRIALILLVLTSSAGAVDFELGVGATYWKKPVNGWWWQNGFDNSMTSTTPTITAGLTGDINTWMRWRAGLAYLGKPKTVALAVSDDANYNIDAGKGCIGECLPTATWRSEGTVSGLYFTLQPHTIFHGLRYTVEIGPFIHRPSWHMTVSNYQYCPTANSCDRNTPQYTTGWDSSSKYRISYVAGVSVGKDDWDLNLRVYDVKTNPEPHPPSYGGKTYSLTISKRF